MARARVNLFPSPTQKRPSNNPQPVFSPVDPFRRQPQQQGTRLNLQAGAGNATQISRGGIARTQDQGIPVDPTLGAIPKDVEIERTLMEAAGLIPPAGDRPALTSLDALALLQGRRPAALGGPTSTVGDSTTVSPAGPAAGLAPEDIAATQLVGTSLAGNPFITSAGHARLRQGLLPLFSDINPAFFRQTEPTLVNALLAQYNTRDIQTQDLLRNVEAGRPRGFR